MVKSKAGPRRVLSYQSSSVRSASVFSRASSVSNESDTVTKENTPEDYNNLDLAARAKAEEATAGLNDSGNFSF